MVFLTVDFAKVFPEKRLELKSLKVERRYGRKHGCDPGTLAAGRGAHLHANWSFSPPPALMAMKLPTIGKHI
jgi:hypothetical protein